MHARTRIVTSIAIVAAIVAPQLSHATHCNEISVYSYVPVYTTGVSWDPLASFGCSSDTNLDLLVPGSTGAQTFWNAAAKPLDGYYDEEGALRGSFLKVETTITLLAFTRGTNANGNPANFWYSQIVPHTQEASVTPGFAVAAHVCTAIESCISREYRSATT